MDYYEIGQRIRKVRKAKGMSQEQLAECANISVTHMSHIETGNTKLSLEVFAAITLALGACADELLFGLTDNAGIRAFEEINNILIGCTPKELCVVLDIVQTTKSALDKYC